MPMPLTPITAFNGLNVPQRDSPADFADWGDTWIAAEGAGAQQHNVLAGQVNNMADAASASQVAAAISAAASNASALDSAASAAAAATSSGVAKWVAGTNYVQGVVVWSPTDFQSYRAKVALTPSNTDPAADATNWQVQPVVKMRRLVRSSNTQLTANDHGSIIEYSAGGFTQTYAACASLRDGWWVILIARAGIADITHDPNGSELIDTVTTGIQKASMSLLVQCNGTDLLVTRIDSNPITIVHTSGTGGSLPIGVKSFKTKQSGAGGSGAKSNGTAPGCPGASGGYSERTWPVASGVKNYAFSLGAPGASQTTASTNGNTGGATTLTYNAVTVTTDGGQGGQNSGASTGGAASGGDVNLRGGQGYFISSSSNNTVNGTNPLGVMQTISNGGTTVAAEGYGSGGLGATSTQNSAAGAPAVIIVEI